MSLTNYFTDIGRPVAYYPSFKRVAFTTTASILLCQLLYWTNKTKDGWIWKTSEQLEEETGLSYEEQKTARAKLRELNLITEDYDRINHELKFKINEDILNDRWSKAGGKVVKSISIPEELKKPKENKTWVDMVKDMAESPQEWKGIKKEEFRNMVKGKFSVRLHVNPDTKRWQEFIEFATNRMVNNNESPDKFIDWLIEQRYFDNSSFWPPNKMMELWPQAFINKKEIQESKIDSFTAKLPEYKEENYVPMPADLFKKKLE